MSRAGGERFHTLCPPAGNENRKARNFRVGICRIEKDECPSSTDSHEELLNVFTRSTMSMISANDPRSAGMM